MHEPLTKYFTSSNIGTAFRCGLNHVVLDHDTALYKADDVEALLSDLVRKWAAQTGAREGAAFRVAMKNIQASLAPQPKEQL